MKKWLWACFYLFGIVVLVLPEILGLSRRSEPVSADGGMIQMDKDLDGRVTFEEVLLEKPEFPKEVFDSQDTNRDGIWTREDRYLPRLLVGRPPFQRVDRDGDGEVTVEEYISSSQEEYNRLDQNADGTVTVDEWPRMRRYGGEGFQGGMPFPMSQVRPPEPEWLVNNGVQSATR